LGAPLPGRRAALGRLAGSAALAGGLGGCASWTPPMTAALRAQPPADLAPRSDLSARVPFIAQDDDLCGPSVLAMLLQAAGLPADLPTLTREVYLPGRQGTLQAEMLAGARRHGALAVLLPPRLDALLHEVAKGTPVGVLLNLGLSWWPRWHYAVLLGHDLAAGTVRLHSGTTANAVWSQVTFEHTWARSGHWAFVTMPLGQLPRTADDTAVLQALVGLDRVLPPLQRQPAWAAAAARWPQNLSLAIGEANCWLAAARWSEAAAAFEAVATRHDSAVAWNNLALARVQLGNRPGALAAAARAVQRATEAEPRWLPAAQQTLDELSR